MHLEIRAEDLTPGGVLRTQHVRSLVEVLVNRGGLALIPSDTCYSLAARPLGPAVAEKINTILAREPIPISLAFDSTTLVDQWVQLTVDSARLLEHLTPGPLTVVCRIREDLKHPEIVDRVLAAKDRTIGVRIPDSHIERQLVTACHHPLTTVAVRTQDRENRVVTDFAEARRIVEQGIKRLERPVLLAIVEGRNEFSPANSTVVRVPGKVYGKRYDIIREGALPTAVLDEMLERPSKWEGGRR
ncbi:MAG TPA: Sua5/YciO/YrdC/YwlC family protein [Thermoanaerobaculia bacterium]